MSTDDMTMHEALTILHEGTDRQGPGDDAFTLGILRRLPELPPGCAIADLGCGTGAAGVVLAQHLRRPVLCVDTCEAFLRTLCARAEGLGVGNLIRPLCADMGSLDPTTHQFDLLWSEGAAYNLTFEGAMRRWRPLVAGGGIAVVSEMSWFGAERPSEVVDHWSREYPEMADEAANIARAERNGFRLLFTDRLPAGAWWRNYYDPLLHRLDAHAAASSRTLQEAIAATRREIDLFRRFSDHYGYTFYALRAA